MELELQYVINLTWVLGTNLGPLEKKEELSNTEMFIQLWYFLCKNSLIDNHRIYVFIKILSIQGILMVEYICTHWLSQCNYY